MSSDLYTTLIVLGFLGIMCLGALVVFGLAYFFILRPSFERSKVVNRNWELFAGQKGLTFLKNFEGGISGSYQGRQVKLAVINPDYDFEDTDGVRLGGVRVRVRPGTSIRHNYMISRTSTDVKTDGLELMVHRRKGYGFNLMIDKIGYFNTFDIEQDLIVGNEAFDAQFRVHCNSPEQVKSILTPEIQSALLERITMLDLHANKLNLNAVGTESRPAVLEAFLELVCKIADKIENQ